MRLDLTLMDFDGHTGFVVAPPDMVVLVVAPGALREMTTWAGHCHLCTWTSDPFPGCTPLTSPLHAPSACDLHRGTTLTSHHHPGHTTLAFDPGHNDHVGPLSCTVKHDQNCDSSVTVGLRRGRECWQADEVVVVVAAADGGDGDGSSSVGER